MSLEITNKTKNNLPIGKLFFAKIADEILGTKYEASLVFIGDAASKKLNKEYRNGDYIPNVLSFPIDKTSGEIFINPNQAKKEASKFEMTYKNFMIYLFIHGCLHLLGHDHSKKMDALEGKFLKKFEVIHIKK